MAKKRSSVSKKPKRSQIKAQIKDLQPKKNPKGGKEPGKLEFPN
jgi:hypothetical protein